VTLQHEIKAGIEQGMARADEGSKSLALWRNEGFLEGNPLVSR
jgi:hypothetical protein